MPVEVVRAPGHDRKRSLGWLGVRWMEFFLIHGPGDIAGTPLYPGAPDGIPLSDELVRYTVDVYALNAKGGRLYDSAFLSRAKGWDKSGQASRIDAFEGMGPCRFAGWAEGGEVYRQGDFEYVYEPGEPMGRPVTYPLIKIFATEEGQADNVYENLWYIMREGPLREFFPRLDDIGLTRIFLPDGGEIRPATASSASKDGGKETHADFDETHLYVTTELKRMYATMRRNLTKRKDAEPWSQESSTMYAPGQDSVAEQTHDLAKRIRDGKVKRPRLLFDHREGFADTDLADEESLKRGLAESYGDHTSFIDLDRKVAEVWDPRNDPVDSRRFYLNQVTAATDAWVAPHEWDQVAMPGVQVLPGTEITLGFDGSKTDDWSALVGCRVDDSHLFTLGLWDPEQHGGEIRREDVDAAVRQAFDVYDIVGFYSDVHPWESYVDSWAQDFGSQLCVAASGKSRVGWDMRGRQRDATQMAEAFHEAILEGDLSHSDDKRANQHVYNARRRPNQYGVTFGKEARESPRKVDWVAAAMLARQCRQEYMALPAKRKRRKRTGRAVFL